MSQIPVSWYSGFDFDIPVMAVQLSPTVFCSMAYDYVISGGGTAGLALASRLSENSNITVAVVEAGFDLSEDFNVNTPGLFVNMLGNSTYDWMYQTAPQADANDRVVAWPRGRLLGGSSGINAMYWTHASVDDIDSWGELGNEGWSWNDLLPYYLKSEKFVAPSTNAAADLEITSQNLNLSAHGESGLLVNGYPEVYDSLLESWPQTYSNLGLAVDGDPRSGNATGGYIATHAVDPTTETRSYAGNKYLKPALQRSNLKILTGAHVNKIIFADSSQGGQNGANQTLLASGVEFSVNGSSYTVNASREVILSAGAIGSPQLLELSGIGSAQLLESLKIEVLLNNSNVGENLQDHPLIPLGFQAAENQTTLEGFRDPKVVQAAIAQYTQNRTGPLAFGLTSSALLSLKQLLSKPGNESDIDPTSIISLAYAKRDLQRPGLAEQYAILSKRALDDHDAVSQVFYFPGGVDRTKVNSSVGWFTADGPDNYISVSGMLMHPFSRGFVHINSSDSTVYPIIDPRYLSHPADLAVLSTIMLHAQAVAQTQPFASHLKNNGTVYQPGYSMLTKENVGEFIKESIGTEYHPVGTCAMRPQDKGGVVDPRLKVYGTANLRVVDASIFPLAVQANPTSLIYALAEKAADMIKEDM